MTHLNLEILSTYLDGELVAAKTGEVERHLAGCSKCQTRLHGLRRVVDRLCDLEPVASPAYLRPEVRRFVALQRSKESMWSRLEAQANRLTLQSPLIPAFAVVIALVLIIYLLVAGVSRQIGSETEVIVPPTAAAGPQIMEIGSRVFEKRDDIWVEKGRSEDVPVRSIQYGDEELSRFIDLEPALVGLESLDSSVWLVLDSELVEIAPTQP